jgi:hypothetical protein
MSYADIDAATVEFRAKKAIEAIHQYRRNKQYELAERIKKKGFRNFWFKKIQDTRTIEEIIKEERNRKGEPFGVSEMQMYEWDFDKAEDRMRALIRLCSEAGSVAMVHVSAKDWSVLMSWYDHSMVAKGEK